MWNYKKTVVYRWWNIVYRDVVRVDRVMYYILMLFMIIVPIALYSYGSWWFDTSLSEHINHGHSYGSLVQSPEECGFAWARFIPFLLLCFSQIAVLVTFGCNIQNMLRNFLNPEYEALGKFKGKF